MLQELKVLDTSKKGGSYVLLREFPFLISVVCKTDERYKDRQKVGQGFYPCEAPTVHYLT